MLKRFCNVRSDVTKLKLSRNVTLTFCVCWGLVYRLPDFLFLCICQLPTCLPPICPPMATDNRRSVYCLSVYLFVCTCQPPTCLPPTCQLMSTNYLSTADLSTADLLLLSFICRPVNSRPVYRLLSTCLPISFYMPTAYLCPLTTCLLPICLPPVCPPMSTEFLSTAGSY